MTYSVYPWMLVSTDKNLEDVLSMDSVNKN